MNVGQLLSDIAASVPGKTAVIFKDEKITYADLKSMATRPAIKLRVCGVVRGDRVAIVLPNSVQWVVSYLGVMKLGAVAVPLDFRLKDDELVTIFKDAQVKTVITSAHYPTYRMFWGLRGIETVIVAGGQKLYFEPLTVEDVLSIYSKEKPIGVIVEFGGQTPLNLAKELEMAGVKILGTSCCDMAVAPASVIGDKLVAGICGQVDGSIIPGMIGLEAGQSAYGDVYAWFKNVLMWPLEAMLPRSKAVDKKTAKSIREEIEGKIIKRLSEEAAKIGSDETVPLALDWLNGRRTPYADQRLKGALLDRLRPRQPCCG